MPHDPTLGRREEAKRISDGIIVPKNIDPTHQQLPWELEAFMMSYDKDVVKNLYGSKVIRYYWDLKSYRQRAKEAKIEWNYKGDDALKDNRWYNKNKDKID